VLLPKLLFLIRRDIMKLDSLQDLLAATLRDLYSVEQQLVKALPKLARAATAPQLSKAFQQHLMQTKEHVKRIEQACSELGIKPGGKKCAGMQGIIEEGEEILKMAKSADENALDAALISAAQHAEHYEMAGYGCAVTYAQELGFDKTARLLQRTLNEEESTDAKLTKIAEQKVNQRAISGAGMQKKAAASRTKSKSTSSRAGRSSAGKSMSSRSTSRDRSSSKSSSGKASKSRSAASSKSAGSRTSRSTSSSSNSSRRGNGSAEGTRDHDLIRQWVEERGGFPTCVRGTGDSGDIGLLRIDYPGYSGKEKLQKISWDEFFEKFDERKLTFLHQDRTSGGKSSRFSKLVYSGVNGKK
jgi:ferritin-like metal-binding protein YciE